MSGWTVYSYTPATAAAAALARIDMYRHMYRMVQAKRRRLMFPPRHAAASKEYMAVLEADAREAAERLSAFEGEVLSFLSSLGLEYVDYFMDTFLAGPAALAVVAEPPDVTWGRPPLVHSGTWINVTFFTFRSGSIKHTSTIAEFFTLMSNAKLLYGPSTLKPYPRLLAFYEEKLSSYRAKGLPPRAARVNAARDAARVVLGNTWLVATLDALERGVLEPCDVEPPYHIAMTELSWGDMIGPGLTAKNPGCWEKYTWRALRDILEDAGCMPENSSTSGELGGARRWSRKKS